MNKGILIGIAIAVIIGIGAIAASQNFSDMSEPIPVDTVETTENTSVETTEPKQFSIDLTESMGFRESP